MRAGCHHALLLLLVLLACFDGLAELSFVAAHGDCCCPDSVCGPEAATSSGACPGQGVATGPSLNDSCDCGTPGRTSQTLPELGAPRLLSVTRVFMDWPADAGAVPSGTTRLPRVRGKAPEPPVPRRVARVSLGA